MRRRIILRLLSRMGMYNLFRGNYIRVRTFSDRVKYAWLSKDFRLPLPKTFVFEPTARCNLSCRMCYFKKESMANSQELSVDKIRVILDNLPSLKKVTLIGGEIFLRKDIFDLLDMLRVRKVSVHLTTNGTLIDGSNIEHLKKNNNIEAIGVSLDGTKELHNSIRRSRIAYDRTIEAIQLMSQHFMVYIVCVITRQNLPYLASIVSLANELGFDNVIFEYERKYVEEDILSSERILGLSREAFSLNCSEQAERGYSFTELESSLKAAEREGDRAGVAVYYLPRFLREELSACYHRRLRKEGRYFCRALFNSRVDWRGDVFHCYAVRESFGNLLNSSFEEIWNNQKYREFRKHLLENNLLPICETCLYMERIS
ncbi:MAG: hypothetical protein A3G93_15195 [Nitrospinae bacterium RIFCSPLOWO2_12_FULL_45_22]|nr:MAG: hypothetical protein A3G93_15195 [Nitrospinae bacterium RIFCSPLOWO2_12_FULL_45_22]